MNMKKLRRTMTLLACLALACTASTASAATKKPGKTFTAVPTIKLADVPGSTKSGELDELTLNASLPGFLDLDLLDASGNVVLTLADQLEIHSNSTTFDYEAVDEDGEPLKPGDYTFRASMVSQFGVASKEVTKGTEIRENKDLKPKATATPKPTAAPKAEESAKATAAPKADEAPKAEEAPKATAAPSAEMTYGEGESKMGDEGLLIGVGVNDAAAQDDAGYWTLSADATDEEIWAALTRKMIGVDVGENESAYIYDSPESGREKIGTVSGISQGLNVITERDDGWALVETYRNEDGAFIRGYIKSSKLRPVEPNEHYGIVVDKAAQTLTVFKDGQRLGSCQVTTGLATPKYLHRETPAGEFITVTRRGSHEYYGMGYYTKYTVRINGNYYLAEIPTTKKNGTKFVEEVQSALGTKSTRGTICLAHDASTDGGINAEWIWNLTDENKRIKVLVLDDKARTEVPVSNQ